MQSNLLTRGQDEMASIRECLVRYPLDRWANGAEKEFFTFEEPRFATTFELQSAVGAGEPKVRAAFQDLVRELADWRLADYLVSRGLGEVRSDDSFTCRVNQTSGRPILKPLPREHVLGIPWGPACVLIDGEPHYADFRKIAVNTLRREPSGKNVLPEVLRSWFGPHAGAPGTRQTVRFTKKADGQWELEYVVDGDS